MAGRRVDAKAGPTRAASYRPGYELAAEELLEIMAKRGLGPGDRLGTEQELAETLQVSRTVAREAVKVLAALGRVTVRKGSGAHVANGPTPPTQQAWSLFLPADPAHVDMLFELRTILEVNASRLAADRATPRRVRDIHEAVLDSQRAAESDDFEAFRVADERFHRAVAAGSANMFIESTVAAIVDLKRQVLTIGLHGDRSGSLLAAATQHAAIAAAISDGDAEAAERAMADHIDVARSQFRREMRVPTVPTA
jgi:DNA-binding FadR family transcriptional regulator